MKRLPNNYGGVAKLSGKRRKPFMAWIPQKTVTLGTYSSKVMNNIEDISKYIDSLDMNEELLKDIKAVLLKHQTAEGDIKNKRVPIGYYTTREEALNALAEYNKLPVDGDIKSLTYKEICTIIRADYIGRKSALSTFDSAYKLTTPLHNKKISQLRTIEMQRCVDAVYDSAPSQQNAIIFQYRAVFKYAIKNDIILKNYALDVVAKPYEKKTKTVFTTKEIKFLWGHIDYKEKSRTSREHKTVRDALIFIYTGCRASELLAVKKEDINLEERYITINGTKTKNANRLVPIHKDILPLMECSQYLIETHQGKPFTYANYKNNIWLKMMKTLDISHTMHEARHTFISVANMQAMNQVILHKIVGHTTKDITEAVYSHLDIAKAVEEIDKLEFC